MVVQPAFAAAPPFTLWRDRIYLENVQQPATARIAFILAKSAGAPPASLDPLAMLDSGCLIDYPETADPVGLLEKARQWVDNNPNDRILLMSATKGELSSIKGKLNQRVTGEVRFGNARGDSGPITGNAHWRIVLKNSVIKVSPDKGLWFDLSGLADVGFRTDPENPAPCPKDEPWVIYPISGDKRGIWTVAAMLDGPLLERMNVGASYFTQTDDSYDRRFFPFFNFAGGSAKRFLLELDCGDPYPANGSRTRLTPPTDPLPSGLNDVHGQPVMLAPSGLDRATRGCFTLAMAPGLIQKDELKELTHQFVPSGTFLASGAKQLRLSMGSSNLETVALDGGAQGVMFDFDKGPALIDAGDAFVDGATRFATAWLKIPKRKRSAQAVAMDPEGMQPYRATGSANAMDFAPSTIALDDIAIPFAPVLGLSTNAAIIFDRKRLSKARRKKLIVQKSPLAPAGPVESLRTPQGYLGERDSRQFRSLVFTRTSARNADPAVLLTDPGDFGLVPKNDAGEKLLADITARSRLCVVTKLDQLLDFFKEDSLKQLYMADWCVQKALAGDPTNFVILKHDPRPLYAADGSGLLQQSDQWTELPGLSLSTPQKKLLRDHVQTSVNDAKTNPLLGPFARRMTAPNWAGLVCVNMLLEKMPDQLGALETLCGKLAVHHIGVDLTAIQKADEPVWKPGMFGLIDQRDAGDFLPKNPASFPMQLQLKELKLLVENDAVRSFDCTILGRPTSLFKTKVGSGQDFELKGKYQSRLTAEGKRQDSYSFSVAHDFIYEFDKDYVLSAIAITRASLVTVIDPQNGRKMGQLSIDGWLKFNKLNDINLLGIERLDFSDLSVSFGIETSFYLKLSYPNLRFDLERFNGLGGVTGGSFLTRLPFKLSGFRIGDFELPKLGYFKFGDIPGVSNTLDNFKLALDFDLDLGSLGALAKKLDRFKLNFLVGWAPGNAKKLALGFKIETGASGGSLDLGIEGIIQLTADHFHVGMDNKMLCLAADNPRLKVFNTPIPRDVDTTLGLYLLADPAAPDKLVEKIGWYGVYNDKSPSGDSPVAISHLALGQRIEIMPAGETPIQEIWTTRQAGAAINQLAPFKSDAAFLDFAQKRLTYAPQRDWFVALNGKFFKVADIQLLLRDPDMYGIYGGFEQFFVDLLYQKLADGVGRYSGELDIRKLVPPLEFGAVSVTLGIIGFEVYTDGGFLISFGFPDHVDWSRSFVAQGGPFMGKGGFYVGRTPAAAIPQFDGMNVDDAFRIGMALRVGLGREFTKGPLFASLSVSLFARLEGAVAKRLPSVVPEVDGRDLALASYVFVLQGEIGILLEIEGRVDLRLVQARVLIRAWVAAGVTLVTGRPIIVHAKAGVQVKVRFAIGRIKIFGKTITIYITLSYATTLRYEWELKGGPQMLALDQIKAIPWRGVEARNIVNAPLQLRLVIEISRRAKGDAVMVLMAMVNKAKQGDPHPFAALATSFLERAAELAVQSSDPVLQRLSGSKPPTMTLLTAQLKALSGLSDADLNILLAKALGGSTIELMTVDGRAAPAAAQEGYAFPLPPNFAIMIAGKLLDFSALPKISDAAVDGIAQAIARQFAQQSAGTAKRRGVGEKRPLVAHMFRDWLQSLALNALDAMQNAWTTDPDHQDYEQIQMSRLVAAINWDEVAGRTGRYLFGGIRIDDIDHPGTNIALFDQAKLLVPVPAQDFTVELSASTKDWLTVRAGKLTIDGKIAAGVGNALPAIRAIDHYPAAARQVARRFDLPDSAALKGSGFNTTLVRLTADLRGQLAVPELVKPKAGTAMLERLALWGRGKATQGQIDEKPQAIRYATLVTLSARIPKAVEKLAGASAVIEILGAGEAERRPLDALFPQGQADPVLSQATVHLALNNGEKGFDIFQGAAGLSVARSTTVRERQPGDVARLAAGGSDDLFFAPASQLTDFVELLRRAAIVNAAGTYLLLDALPDPIRGVLEKADAQIALLITYPTAANGQVPAQAVNAAVLDAALPADKRLIAIAKGDPLDPVADRLFETVSLREPGSALIRFWRKPPLADDAVNGNTPEAHLDALFDMLEFGVTGDGDPMPIEASLPLASEHVSRDDREAYTPEQHADFDLPAGWDKGLRYDLLVPLYRWAKPSSARPNEINPYRALQRANYKLDYGWRDMFGNRLGAIETLSITPAYHDALEPVGAWPGIGCNFAIGAKPNQFLLSLFELPMAELPKEERDRALLKAIHQLEGPHVEIRLESSFGALDVPKDFADQLSTALRALLTQGRAKQWTISVTPFGREKHPRLDLRLVVTRTKGCVPDGPADVRSVTSPIDLVVRDKASSTEADSTVLAREFHVGFAQYALARGVDDDGASRWWAVDRRLFPTRKAQAPDILAQPPLALAALAARDVAFTSFEQNGRSWNQVTRTVDVPSVDSDAVFADLLDRIERFVGPGLAPMVTRHQAAFCAVMQAKHDLLKITEGDKGLFGAVRGVLANGPDNLSASATAARRVLRMASGNDFRAFYEVSAVLVQAMDFSKTPKNWLEAGEAAPKIFGRLALTGSDGAIRSMTYGIPLSADGALAIALFGDKPGQSSIDVQNDISFEITHVEREVEEMPGGGHATPAASRWLTIIPFQGEVDRRTIMVTKGKVSIPVPIRVLPKPPILANPTVARTDQAAASTAYDDLIAAVCRWQYGFALSGLATDSDEACCRLVYNVDPTQDEIKDTKTAAKPLFDGLAPQLARCQQAMAGIWDVLADPQSTAFGDACTVFAGLVTNVAKVITTPALRVRNAPERAEDRFIVKRTSEKAMSFRFADHIDNRPDYPIQLEGARAQIGGVGWKAVDRSETPFALPTAHQGKDLTIRTDGMRIPRLQSVWAAASIRRNANLHASFIYRTDELFVQEPLIPFIEARETIELKRQKSESLADRLVLALKPLLGGSTKRKQVAIGSPAQLRLAVESIGLYDKMKSFGFDAEPDPKVQLVTAGDESLQAIATQLADMFAKRLGADALGRPGEARLILSVLMLTEERQPLLDVRRISIPLTGLTL